MLTRKRVRRFVLGLGTGVLIVYLYHETRPLPMADDWVPSCVPTDEEAAQAYRNLPEGFIERVLRGDPW